MIPDAEIARARAALPHILPMPLKREAGLLKGLCPFHREKSPSFTVYPSDWHYYCFGCQAYGDAFSYLAATKGLDFLSAAKELLGVETAPHFVVMRDPTNRGVVSHPEASRETEVPSLVSELWRGATRPSLASWYLQSRGLTVKSLPEALRGHERVWCTETGEHRPCMLAAITDGAGRITAVQRTWVEARLEYDGHSEFPKGARAADLKAPKKTIGPMGAGAVKLAAAGETLGLSEGVESALAAARLYRLPTWSTCGSARLGNVTLPECVKQVLIFGDRDEAGEREAAKAESAYRRRGYRCQIEYPDPAYGDFAEQVLRCQA